MNRIPEPELMTDAKQAKAYASADFSEPHSRFIRLFAETFPGSMAGRPVLDLGCGPGDVTVRFARAHPEAKVIGIDGSAAMLDLARANAAEFGGRVEFVLGCIPEVTAPALHYEAIISNSILHQLHRPEVLWEYVKRYSSPGTRIFIMDLMRPDSESIAKDMMIRYAGSEPPILQRDFYNSLLAAFKPSEVVSQLRAAGLSHLAVKSISDRHLLIYGHFEKS